MNQIDPQARVVHLKREMVRSNGWTILLQEFEKRREGIRESALKAGVSGPDREAAVAAGMHAGFTAAIQILREWEDAASAKNDRA